MEIYAGNIERIRQYVYLDGQRVEADTDVALNIYDSEGQLITTETADLAFDDDNRPYYYVTIGQDITNDYEVKTIEWEYQVDGQDVITPAEFLIVVNPYITYQRFMEMYPGSILSYNEFALVEPVVRKVIETYCNQDFTREDNVAYSVKGQNSDHLPLPKQIIDLEQVEVLDPAIDSAGNETPYNITQYVTVDEDDRWHIRRRTTWNVNRSLSPTHNRRLFKYPSKYRVMGSWGWDMVPQDVSRAAAILINDYVCSDAKYREKYIANIRAGDWRMEFVATGDETTGNANADMILAQYRNVGLAVI